MLLKREFYINGQWVEPAQGHDFHVIDPSTEVPFAVISLGGQKDTDAAVAAAKSAFAAWSETAPSVRLNYVQEILKQYDLRKNDLANAITCELGAPKSSCLIDQVECLPRHLNSFVEAFDQIKWRVPIAPQLQDNVVARSAIGVVGLITPWNRPINQITLKVIPALLAGCTVVLKPSEETPISAMILAELIDAAGLPNGVFNLINGDGEGVGTQLSSHPDVEMISFTGSTRAGRAIFASAAPTLKHVALELGGKGANLVFADADDEAVMRGTRHCFFNSGQACNAPSRMLVERSYYEEAIEIAQNFAESTVVSSAHADGKHLGPVVNKRQWDRIQSLIQSGIEEGARLVTGGLGRPDGLEIGYFVRPTIFADVAPGMTIEREEIFGPVLSIIPFDSEEEAIAIANNTRYGLTNYVQSADTERCNRIALKLRSGMIEVNGVRRDASAFFGGIRDSGRAREGGIWGIEEFLNTKLISGWNA